MSTLTDDEYVARVEASLAHLRARNKAFLDAVENIVVPPLHESVRVRFDSNATLVDVDVAPEALTAYTHVELEQIITEVLQQTRAHVTEAVNELFVKFLVPSDPRFDPDAIGEPYVEPPGPED
jgi:hypothetical protein